MPLRDVRRLYTKWPGASEADVCAMDRADLERKCKAILEDAFEMLVAHHTVNAESTRAAAISELQKVCPLEVVDERYSFFSGLLTGKPHASEPHADAPTRIEQYVLQLTDYFCEEGRYPKGRRRSQR